MNQDMSEAEEFCGRMSVEVEHLYERLADIEGQLAELRSLLAARLDSHECYHRENEHRWGVIQWCHRYPFRMLAIAALTAAAFVPEIRAPLLNWVLEFVRAVNG